MTRGLTLIELVVAMAVFALVAIMGLQSLSGSLRLRDRLTETSDATAALGQAAALLRNDLSSALPLIFFPPDEARPSSALRAATNGQGFALSLGGQPALIRTGGAPDASPRQRAEWRLDATTGRLMRRTWPTLYPVSANQVGPEVLVLEDVEALEMRSFWDGDGWIDGLSPKSGSQPAQQSGGDDEAFVAQESYSSALPRAVDITLITRDHGRITLMEFLQ